MRIKCNYCGGYLEDTDVNCPHCNAPNEHLKRSADGIPKTIEELKIFAAQKKIPLSQMRFFIDYDMREPRAYGIYKDEEGNFVVYKNKSNGERVIRYKGSDEAYAVNEIYQKLRTEMAEQKMHQAEKMSQKRSGNNTRRPYRPNKSTTRKPRKNTKEIKILLPIIICWSIIFLSILLCVTAFFSGISHSDRHNSGSYYNSNYDYDYDDDDWDYNWDDDDDWDYDWDDDDWDYDDDWDDWDSDWDSDW